MKKSGEERAASFLYELAILGVNFYLKVQNVSNEKIEKLRKRICNEILANLGELEDIAESIGGSVSVHDMEALGEALATTVFLVGVEAAKKVLKEEESR